MRGCPTPILVLSVICTTGTLLLEQFLCFACFRISGANDIPHLNSSPDEKSIYIDANTRIQVVDTMLMLPLAEKEQSAAFIVRVISYRTPTHMYSTKRYVRFFLAR